MICINKFIACYFLSKFVDATYSRYLELPKLSSPSTILTDQLYALLLLNNYQLQRINSLDLLYSISKSGLSFKGLSEAIVGYKGPTLFLFKHIDKESQTSTEGGSASECIFGAYTNSVWKEDKDYQGDLETFVFSLAPKYKQFQASKGNGGKSFAYFNTQATLGSDLKPGLGFGGFDKDSFRIWIGEDIGGQSYTQPNDATYEQGFLVRPDIQKLNVKLMWCFDLIIHFGL